MYTFYKTNRIKIELLTLSPYYCGHNWQQSRHFVKSKDIFQIIFLGYPSLIVSMWCHAFCITYICTSSIYLSLSYAVK